MQFPPLNASEAAMVRAAIRPGVLLNEHRGTTVESITPDLWAIRLVGDPRLFQLGRIDDAVTYWPEGEMQHDHDCVVIYQDDAEVVAYYGS